jgi:hypothetical protein
MTIVATREQAAAAVAAAVTERDTIQANLLELDGSFGKRMLAGATLRGQSQQRWAAADAQLAALWQLFGAYSAVVDKAAQVAEGLGRSTSARIAEISSLLSGPAVRLAGVVTPLGQRDLTSGGQTDLPLQAAVAQMRQAFSIVSAVCTAAETVWNEVADRLQRASANLDTAKRQTAGIDDGALAGPLGAADANLSQLREQLNTDPLAFWQGGRADTSRLDLLDSQVAAVAARASELATLRADADRRIAAVRAEVSAAQSAWQDAAAAQQRLAEKITGAAPPPLPDAAQLSGRLDGLASLHAAGRWTRLATELDALSRDAATTGRDCRAAEQAAAGDVEHRDELRGMLDAYQAKAGAIGAAENAGLDTLYKQARDLLWTAPCDIAAADAAVTRYQQAVLAFSAAGGVQGGRPPGDAEWRRP